MAELTAAQLELATLIVDSLNLEELDPAGLDADAPLFGDGGLGLDSIDALEIALAVSRHYGCQLGEESADKQRIFASLRALAAHVEQHRTRA